MGLGAGTEMFEQSAGVLVGAFEVSGFSAMGHDVPGGRDQIGVELQRPAMRGQRLLSRRLCACAIPGAVIVVAKAQRIPRGRESPAPASPPAPASRWLVRWASAAAEARDCADRVDTPRRGRASIPTSGRRARRERAASPAARPLRYVHASPADRRRAPRCGYARSRVPDARAEPRSRDPAGRCPPGSNGRSRCDPRGAHGRWRVDRLPST